MKLRSKIGAFVAATVCVVAISAAPANAASKPALPSLSSLGSYCKQIKDPKLASACTTVTSGKPVNVQSLLGSLGGGKAGSLNLQSLLSQLGTKTGGFNIQSLLLSKAIAMLDAGTQAPIVEDLLGNGCLG